MPPIEAPKKAAKKAAKKAHGLDPNKAGKDTRRAYEHLGRIQTLLPLQNAATTEKVKQLVTLAQGALQTAHAQEAADLLRAAEHLSFGSLFLADLPDQSASQDLIAAIRDEIDHQQEKRERHGEAKKSSAMIRILYRWMADSSSTALSSKRYRAALEFARGAEALTHVDSLASLPLPSGATAKQLSR